MPLAIVLAVLFLMPGSAAWAADQMYARVSHDSGGALVKGSQDTDWSYATVNTLILPGDTVWVEKQGIMEVEMPGGSFLRLADASKAEIDQLPPSANVLAWTGSFYIQRVSRSTGDFSIKTPAAIINVDRDTQLRVDVVGDGATTVSVHWGRATVGTQGGAPVTVKSGYRVYVDPGLLPSEPMPFDRGQEDSFDAWNRERAKTLALGEQNLPAPIATTRPVGYADLASYGDWVYVDNRTYWRPTVVTDYVPYRSGYWSYVPSTGYVWVGTYPFSYMTSHYGRWTYNSGYGWLWCYDPVWSPAWAVTVRYGDNFVWAPLNIYDQPCYYGGASFTVGDVRISIGASSYCPASSLLYYGPCATYPAYGNLFTNVNTNNIYIWNINIGNRHRSTLPYYRSTALVRDYTPQRAIRGLTFGTSTRLAADQAVSQLESTRGRAVFAAASISTRAGNVRTSDAGLARSARIRTASISVGDSQDPRSLVRRAERNLATLREMDSRPERLSIPGSHGTRNVSAGAATVPPAGDSRAHGGRTLRNTDAAPFAGRATPRIASTEDSNGRTPALRERMLNSDGHQRFDRSGAAESGSASTGRTPARSLTRADRQPQETSRPDFSRIFGRTDRGSNTPGKGPAIGEGGRTRTTVPERTASVEGRSLNDRAPWSSRETRSPLGSMTLPSRAGARTTAPEADRTAPPTARTFTAPPAMRTTPPSSNTSRRTEAPTLRTLPGMTESRGNASRWSSTPAPRTESRQSTPAPRTTAPSPRFEAPRATLQTPRFEAPRTTTPSPRFEAPRATMQTPRFEAPRTTTPSPRFEARGSNLSDNRMFQAPARSQAPSFNIPRASASASAPSPRFSAPDIGRSAASAPSPRFERPSFSQPSRPSFSAPSRSLDIGARSSGAARSIERPSFGGGARGRR